MLAKMKILEQYSRKKKKLHEKRDYMIIFWPELAREKLKRLWNFVKKWAL